MRNYSNNHIWQLLNNYFCQVLKNQASFITNKLEMFEQTYLADGSGGASGSE